MGTQFVRLCGAGPVKGALACMTIGAICVLAMLSPNVAGAQSCTSTPAPAPCFQGLGYLPGDNESFAYGVSGDGTVGVGFGGNDAFRWVSGTLTKLPPLVSNPSQ